jgi:hypothetical protein
MPCLCGSSGVGDSMRFAKMNSIGAEARLLSGYIARKFLRSCLPVAVKIDSG